MPLPDRGATWPPPDMQTVYDTYREWDAWYVGDPDGLRSYYGTGSSPASSRGGLLGAVARFFWGRPAEATQTSDGRLHVPVAADIAMTSADLLFGEQVDITSDDEAAAARLAEIADDGMHATLVEAAEIAAALGGVYLRVAWDTTLADAPWIDAVHPDAAVPEWRWGRLAAVTFWRQVAKLDGDQVLRLLERHEPGRIEYGLYQGSKGELGRRIPLTDHPDTERLAALVDAGSGVQAADQRMTAVYVPNVRPSRRWRNMPAAAPLGRSDLDGVERLMDALDETYSSWMRDVRLGKGRILVPSYMLESNGRGQGATFSLDREVFVGLNVEPAKGGTSQTIEAQQFEIRVEEHQQTAQAILEEILRTAGYSAQTYGLSGDVAVTATEVAARERRSYMTRDKKIRYWRPALAYILESLLAVDARHFGGKQAEVAVHFPDGVSDSLETLARTADMLNRAEAASTQTLVEMLHPDWEKKQVDEEVERIQTGRGAGLPGNENPEDTLAGHAGNRPPVGEDQDDGQPEG